MSSRNTRRRRIIWGSIVGVLALVLLLFGDLIRYGLGQAQGQFHILLNARPVAEVIADSTTSEHIRERLLLAEEIREYAMQNLGLAQSENYTTFFDQEGKDLMFVVAACEPFALEAKRWSFPIIGSFPYKGYFDSTKAQTEAEMWRQAGYDVRVRVAGGWSTLGYFKDPILSKMLDRSEGALAEVIIHELTHATIFVKDSVEFNENLATFIGERGAELFLAERYGENSPQLVSYTSGQENGRVFANHILRGAQRLDSLYQAWPENADSTYKAGKKRAMIEQIVNTIDTLSFQGEARYGAHLRRNLPNNAYFMSYLRYREQQSTFSEWYAEQYRGDLIALLNDMKERYPSL
ncbi:MAG TPA: aminopeptidase [Cytophagales bacterium]|nr:aminopeptidase [Cytophagales bacterium]HAA23349.1 aminopeptidase [Cytophagales bacterium]HAP65019.1 aminopeptidase [Cytophagales bacterium]